MSIEQKLMVDFLKDLSAVLKKHNGGFGFSHDYDSIFAYVGDDLANKSVIGRPRNGKCSSIEMEIKRLENA